ncbi:6-bladed beta-propeller [Proteiniphilum saccharofermentans]|uniref:6-bladed beta-propeller n=1 Tax=Proteiniphilum saccharofermentans TaxID=1642647 RepID=UPI0028AA4CE3|nr:6-bladed beta-propeller [Proteiniphilum saccharofermentans]
MKKVKSISAIILFGMMAGIGGCKQSDTRDDELITVDVTANYPKKEVILQDFMDVEYIPLETNDEFVTQGKVLEIGNKYILVKNQINDGDLFIFDRESGKGIRKINRRGQGAEEYIRIDAVVLDEENNEIFVNCDTSGKIFVYDLSGNFKRDLAHGEGPEYLYIFNYDRENLIRYDDGKNKGIQSYHAIISKQDGSITRDIPIPFDKIKTPTLQMEGGLVFTNVSSIIPYHDNWLLAEASSDTIYHYLSGENKLIPFLIKTPSSTDPEIFLNMGALTDRFYFMQTIEMTWDTAERWFSTTDLMYDKQEDALFRATVLNGDYLKKQEVNMTSCLVNSEIAICRTLEAGELVEAYENDELKGKLKEIAAGLDEDSNPVIMLIKHKK